MLTVIAFIVALGLLVTIHELGHYSVARWCGVHVERFSFGFGKVLFKRTDKRGCEWAFSALPLGGYVMMRNEPPENATAAEVASAYNAKTLWQRSAITVAGPVANLVLAVLLYALIGAVGTQEPAPIIGPAPENSVAASAHIPAGSIVTAVDGRDVASWNQFRWNMMDALASGRDIQLATTDPSGVAIQYDIALPKVHMDPDKPDVLAEAGFVLMPGTPVVKELVEGSVAGQAGVQVNDLLLSVNGQSLQTADQFVQAILPLANQTAVLRVEREGTQLTIPVAVAAAESAGKEIGRVGIKVGNALPMVTVRYGVLDSIQQGFTRTIDTLWMSLKMIGRMLIGEVSVKNLSGPVSIADYAGQSASIGVIAYLNFLALISISIGLLNLLPIPMLDGGHLLYYAIEALQGRPLSEAWQARGRAIGLGILAFFMVLAFTNDFTRLFS
ncbi:RIP metalloprotease RseP [Paenalcaligenes suwonensis]|uniref:RIP metalloprotease RseP n=1 Tax=Paenalcaligenes suwonensis TaxID=1202713 RepID=UPI00140A47A7|nr:RIP metalloprotease RseP [Paenalcaligenes suwonensis]NHC62291.1 RIP metalloprotease RseP [Paenalcaligenes suwonensis]